jgi:CRP-like cAMP-binding protein
MSAVREPIAKMDFFAGLDRKLLRKVEESAIVCQYGKGEVIVKEGEMGLGMFVILRGRVEVTENRNGLEARLAELGPEQFFAEMSLIDDKPRSATITTIEETECLLMTRDSFVKLMEKNPQLSIRLARVLAQRLRQANERSQAAASQQPALAASASPSASAAAQAAASVVPVVSNGLNHAACNTAVDSSAKAAVQQKLLAAFEWLYTMKAFTRFSVAVLGCPVEGTASNLIEEIRVGDVKALILPAGEPVEMHIEAYGAGAFNLHYFTPENSGVARFGPVGIQPGDLFTFTASRSLEMALVAHGHSSERVD